MLEDYLNTHTMTVEIINCRHKTILSKVVTEVVTGNILETVLQQTETVLSPDIYRVKLTLESEDGPVVLFAEHDSFVRIVA